VGQVGSRWPLPPAQQHLRSTRAGCAMMGLSAAVLGQPPVGCALAASRGSTPAERGAARHPPSSAPPNRGVGTTQSHRLSSSSAGISTRRRRGESIGAAALSDDEQQSPGSSTSDALSALDRIMGAGPGNTAENIDTSTHRAPLVICSTLSVRRGSEPKHTRTWRQISLLPSALQSVESGNPCVS